MVKSHVVHDAAVGSGSGRIHSMPSGVHHHHQPVDPVAQAHAVFAFYVIMVTMIGMQLGLVWWKRVHKRSYELVTLMGLWLVPAVISVVLHFWLFVLVWFAYSLTSAVYLSFCMAKKLNPATPRMVYRWFLGVHKVCLVVGVTGYILLFIEVMGLGVMLETFLPKGLFLQAVWYGLYFGVLNRDAAEVAADRMSVLMGTRRKLAVSVNKCGICDGDLNDFSHLQAAQAPAQSQPQWPQAVQLACKHLFHDHCIRGWTIVGKKDTCPTCMEKVDFKALYNDRPWETRNMTWIQMLDFVRYMVVWNPILLLALHFFFNWLGFGHEGDHLDPHAHAAYSLNATFAELNSSAGNHTALLQILQRIPADAAANASLANVPSNALLNSSVA